MNIEEQDISAKGIRLSLSDGDQEVARAFLYIMHNDLHEQPFGLLEDVYVDESCRGRGFGTTLVEKVVSIARDNRCYKIIATSRKSRPRVHELYGKLGFENYGYEFRMNL